MKTISVYICRHLIEKTTSGQSAGQLKLELSRLKIESSFVNQPHLADFDSSQRARTQHSSQILNVVPAMEGCIFDGYAIIEYKWIR